MDFSNLFSEYENLDEISSFLPQNDIYPEMNAIGASDLREMNGYVLENEQTPNYGKVDEEKQHQIQELQNRILEKEHLLEVNQKLQKRIIEQLGTLQQLLGRKEQEKGDDSNSLSYNDASNTDPVHMEDRTTQFLRSFPVSEGTTYFSQQSRKLPRFKLSDGGLLVPKPSKKSVISKTWTKRKDELLQALVLKTCEGIVDHVAVPDDEQYIVTQYKQATNPADKQKYLQRLVPSLLGSFSWDTIAYKLGHSPADCFVHWMNHCDPFINHTPWTLDEDTRLFQIVTRHHARRWVAIAAELNTGRVPIQCIQRYVRYLETQHNSRSWSEQEDAALLESVRRQGRKAWNMVAKDLPGRTANQCRSRYFQALQQQGKKGRWGVWEKCRLLLYMYFYGENWTLISQKMISRNIAQCRDQWFRCLHPTIRHERWKAAEDKLLLSLVRKKGIRSWTEIATRFPGRTADMCKTRYNSIKPKGGKGDA